MTHQPTVGEIVKLLDELQQSLDKSNKIYLEMVENVKEAFLNRESYGDEDLTAKLT